MGVGIDHLYENTNPNSNVKYVVDEAKFGGGRLGMTKDGKQMSNDWLMGSWTGNNRILDAVDGDFRLSNKITDALRNNQVERVLSKVDSSGNVKTLKLDLEGNEIGERSEEHTSELQSRFDLVCRLLLEKKKTKR